MESPIASHDDTRCASVHVAPCDLRATMAQQHLGRFDPTGRRGADWFEKVHLDRDGRPLVWRLARTGLGLSVHVRGAGAAALADFTAQFPLQDGGGAFAPEHPVLRRLARAFNGLRLVKVPWLFDVAAGAVLQQRVRWQVGYNDFRRVALRWGTRTPGGVAFPTAQQLAAVPVAMLEAFGIDAKRARALSGLARAESFHRFLRADADPGALRIRLLRIPGIGPWTAGMIAGYGAADPDAVPVGDLHLPSLVTATLAGEAEGTDERMLELLEPYRGQRFRVVRLITWAYRHAPHLLLPARRA